MPDALPLFATAFSVLGKKMNLLPSLARMRMPAPLLLVLASAALAVGAYLQALNFHFESDDAVYIISNAKLAGLQPAGLWRLFTEPYNPYEFLPLRDLSYWFDIKLFGLNPAAFRVHSIILYLLCVVLVYAATLGLWRYFRPEHAAGGPWLAATVTALYALDPALVESVVWVSGRKDILSAMFSLLAIWSAVQAKRDRGISPGYATASLLALLAAILSKATAASAAPVIAVLWLLFWRDAATPDRPRTQLLWPFASLILAAGSALVFAANSTIREPVYTGIEAATRALAISGWMARLSISPESRHFYYPVLDDVHLFAMAALGLAVLAAAMAGGVMAMRKRSLEGFLLLAFLLLCLPYIQLLPYRTHSLVADRFLTLALWPAVMLMVVLIWRLQPVPRIAILAVIASAWGLQTIERPRDWQNTDALFDSDLRAFPGYYVPAAFKVIFNQLPQGLYREAAETAGNISNREIRDVMTELVKTDYAVHVTAAGTGKAEDATWLLWKLGQEIKLPDQAGWDPVIKGVWEIIGGAVVDEWKSLSREFPDDEAVHYNAGLWLLKVGKYEDAAVQLRAATESQRLAEAVRGAAYKNLGIALLAAGNVAGAEMPLGAALLQAHPDLSAYCPLAVVYRRTGRIGEALHAEAECRAAVSGRAVAQ